MCQNNILMVVVAPINIMEMMFCMNKIYIFIVLFAIVLGGCQIGDEKTNIHKQNSNEFLNKL